MTEEMTLYEVTLVNGRTYYVAAPYLHRIESIVISAENARGEYEVAIKKIVTLSDEAPLLIWEHPQP